MCSSASARTVEDRSSRSGWEGARFTAQTNAGGSGNISTRTSATGRIRGLLSVRIAERRFWQHMNTNVNGNIAAGPVPIVAGQERQGKGNSMEITSQEKNDPVNHPSHYTAGKIEVIDFIEDQKLGYHLGNALKYICRAGRKNPAKTTEDLQKAVWYINRYIELLEKGDGHESS